MSSRYLVELDHVHKAFCTRHFLQRDEDTGKRVFYKKRTVHAARDVAFGIQPGEIFGLLGPNGAGKTTTVKMISGLVRPDRGVVYVDELSVEKKRLEILKRVGVVLEGTRTSIWPLTPLENLVYYGNLKNVTGRTLKERAKQLLEFIGLKDKMNIQVRRLSRGEKQKLAICIALIADPPVILLDEPTTGLDVQSSRNIKDKIIEMTREQGKCVLVTTHDMHVAQEICDRIGIIDKGRLIACKPTEHLLELFSDLVFEIRLDRLPPHAELSGIPGVRNVEFLTEEGVPTLVVWVEDDAAKLSEALYATIERLRQGRYLLRGVTQRQQTLENVFLRLTNTAPTADSAPREGESAETKQE
jgi:ABC-2 type transport system ATP-binding protein